MSTYKESNHLITNTLVNHLININICEKWNFLYFLKKSCPLFEILIRDTRSEADKYPSDLIELFKEYYRLPKMRDILENEKEIEIKYTYDDLYVWSILLYNGQAFIKDKVINY